MRRRERGGLEAAVLQHLWRASGPLTSTQLRMCFEEQDRPAPTTVLTVLDRLEGKDLVVRTAAKGGALFAAVRSESEEAASAMSRRLARTDDRATALMHFAGQLDEADLDALRRVIEGDQS